MCSHISISRVLFQIPFFWELCPLEFEHLQILWNCTKWIFVPYSWLQCKLNIILYVSSHGGLEVESLLVIGGLWHSRVESCWGLYQSQRSRNTLSLWCPPICNCNGYMIEIRTQMMLRKDVLLRTTLKKIYVKYHKVGELRILHS